jgi:GNAT superfamily N-acetyltransferase
MPDPMPALVLGRLAADHRYQGAGIGQALLKDALARSINVSEQVGARVLIVHALNDKAEAFYLKHGFVTSFPVPNTLLLPLK